MGFGGQEAIWNEIANLTLEDNCLLRTTLKELCFSNPYSLHIPSFCDSQEIEEIVNAPQEFYVHTEIQIIDKKGLFVAIVHFNDVLEFMKSPNYVRGTTSIEEFLKNYQPNQETLPPSTTLECALIEMKKTQLPLVITENKKLLTIVYPHDLLRHAQEHDVIKSHDTIAIYGKESLSKFPRTQILISGINSVGVEIVRLLANDNMGVITLHDSKTVSREDVESTLWFQRDDIGCNRAEACVKRFLTWDSTRRLNSITRQALSESIITHYDTVILVGVSYDESMRVNDLCRKCGAHFLRADVHGLAGSIFSDYESFRFSPTRTIHDVSVAAKSINNRGEILLMENEPFGEICRGDKVLLHDFRGMDDINGREFEVIECKKNQIIVGDFASCGIHKSGGRVEKLRVPMLYESRTLKESLDSPKEANFFLNNISYSNNQAYNAEISHLFRSLDAYVSKYNSYPVVNDFQSLSRFTELFQQFSTKEGDKQVIKQFLHGCGIIIPSMSKIIAGLLCEEVKKIVCKLNEPLTEWFYFEAFDILSDIHEDPTEYHSDSPHVKLFGRTITEDVANLSYLLMCENSLSDELLQAYVAMGMSQAPRGRLRLSWTHNEEPDKKCISLSSTRDDLLPLVKKLQERANVELYDYHPTLMYYDTTMWESLDGISCSSSKMYSRSDLAVSFKVMSHITEASGCKGSAVAIIPRVTQVCKEDDTTTFGCNPPFPYRITHCITQASSKYDTYFYQLPSELLEFIQGNNATMLTKTFLDTFQKGFSGCVMWARDLFQELFVTSILELQIGIPRKQKNSYAEFWGPPRRFPRPVHFQLEDETHFQFIVLLARVY